MKNLGKTIHELRLQKNLTIEALAFRTGISVSHMGYIERGTKTNITVETLQKIANALEIKPYQLLLYSSEKKEGGCPLSTVLVRCLGCEKEKTDMLDCCTATRICTAEQLLTDSNISYIEQIKEKISHSQPKYHYEIFCEILLSEDYGYYKTYGISCRMSNNPTHTITKISDISIEKEIVLNLVDLCNEEQLDPIHLSDVVYDALSVAE